MVEKKVLSKTKNAIYYRKQRAEAKALKGSKPLILPPQDVGWKQHHTYHAYYGRPDGQVWSAKLGRILKGTLHLDGYRYVAVDGKSVKMSRFNLSLSLARPIGEGMECDHIVPVKKGGGDAWANLQELTRQEHNCKTTLDNPEAGKKRGVTLGVPIIATHVGTRHETRFDSARDAARELGISRYVITRSIKGEEIDVDYVFSHASNHLTEQADMLGEMWRDAVSRLGLLPNIMASNHGRIQDSYGRRNYGSDRHGYKYFRTTIDKKSRQLQVHDVIGRTFRGPPPSLEHTADHINRDPFNNRVENLRWATQTEQNRNQSTNRSVIQLESITGAHLAVFGSIAAAAEAVGTSPANISAVVGGRGRTATGLNGDTKMNRITPGFLINSRDSGVMHMRTHTACNDLDHDMKASWHMLEACPMIDHHMLIGAKGDISMEWYTLSQHVGPISSPKVSHRPTRLQSNSEKRFGSSV
jgi:hypothetical protein